MKTKTPSLHSRGASTGKVQELLRTGDILDRIVKDMEHLGYIGENDNKILGYLIGLSRKLEEPLSGIVVSSSGVGKSKLVDTIQIFTPNEDVVFASKLTPQSLYYMTKDFLKNKLLVIEERTGSELADYAIRTLQSKGSLTLAAPVKSQTVFFEVQGPVSILETTTSYRLNAENVSRCFILHLDESKIQTERIHRYQRLLKTQKGMQIRERNKAIIQFHHNMQRLILPLPVIIPFAEKLSFPIHSASSRRDNQKLLTLIESIALLHQYQRKQIIYKGKTYIQATIQDYKLAHSLFKQSYKNTIMLTHPKANFLLTKISQIEKKTFTRQDISEHTGWPKYIVRDNIKFLEDTGMLSIISNQKGREMVYELSSNINFIDPKEVN